jgi:uncharacterized protein (TIGR03067 family)
MAMVLAILCGPAFSQEKDDLASALDGEWEVVEMIYRGKTQDFGGKPEHIMFAKGGFWLEDPDDDGKYRFGRLPWKNCTIRPNEIDLLDRFSDDVAKVLYQLKDGQLWLCWGEKPDSERPIGFGAVADTNLTLRILKRVEKAK